MTILQSGQKQQLVAFLILGISPRKEFDEQYRGFFDLIANHVATAIANFSTCLAEQLLEENQSQMELLRQRVEV
jgi:GAF domain-containing protein